MKRNQNTSNHNNNNNKGNTTTNGFLPNSFRFISSCIKTVSSNVRSAGASVAVIAADSDDHRKDQVLWACFDRFEVSMSEVRRVLLLGYFNGFQVLDVEDASNISELVSRRDNAVTFMQMLPNPATSDVHEGFKASYPLLLVVANEETTYSGPSMNWKNGSLRDNVIDPETGAAIHSPTAVRFYSLRSHNYVHVLRFRSAVYMVRCSPKIVAVSLAAQIYCFDALTLENRFSVLTYPVPQLLGHGFVGVNIGYGPMAVGPRWLAYASNNPLLSNTGRLSPQSPSPSPGVSPSTSPGNGNLLARYAMESSKQLAVGLINLGDMGYKTFSKYCHELLPDGSSSPESSNSRWKVCWTAPQSSETDAAGTVVIKDFVSRAVVSQFRAHTSPISALCFDPSGTLLVTASINGNNINIFRIMPSYLRNGLGKCNSSHVHLYKLHRGLTSAVIQDICFNPYSQWVVIVSSKGTGHVYFLSPFGGETSLQLQNCHLNGHSLSYTHSAPWWSTSSFMINQISPPPPSPITLSVVSRIKNSGWLNTVGNAASLGGKVSVPFGVVAAVFHSSVCQSSLRTHSDANALEHLMVYSPSGNVIQYELLPSVEGEQGKSSLINGTSSPGEGQDEELRVKVGPVQWWDVCRRADWPEREEFRCSEMTLGRKGSAELQVANSGQKDHDNVENDMNKLQCRSHWYFSNAEVQMGSGRIPVWKKSMVSFYALNYLEFEEENLYIVHNGGETEMEKLTAQEIEIRHKNLLPVSDHFHRINPERGDGRALMGRYWPSSSLTDCSKEKFSEYTLSHKKLLSSGSGQISHGGFSHTVVPKKGETATMKSYPPFSPFMNGKDKIEGPSPMLVSPLLKQSFFSGVDSSSPHKLSTAIISNVKEDYIINHSSSSKSCLSNGGTIASEVLSSNSDITGDVSNTSSNRSDLSMNVLDEELVHEDMHDQLDFGQYFQEGYCKAASHDECHKLTEVGTDVDCSTTNPCNKGSSEDDGENDDMLLGVFAFSEEGCINAFPMSDVRHAFEL